MKVCVSKKKKFQTFSLTILKCVNCLQGAELEDKPNWQLELLSIWNYWNLSDEERTVGSINQRGTTSCCLLTFFLVLPSYFIRLLSCNESFIILILHRFHVEIIGQSDNRQDSRSMTGESVLILNLCNGGRFRALFIS